MKSHIDQDNRRQVSLFLVTHQIQILLYKFSLGTDDERYDTRICVHG